MAKDLFSQQAAGYARFRPTFPAALFDWVAGAAPGRALAVDVGTGNGQAALELAERFERVVAVDPSEAQLANATPHARVTYRRGEAEATGVGDGAADLIAASQAFHWFDQPRFFAEARRALRPRGVVAAWCYGLSRITPEIDAVVMELYEGYLGAYWDPERRMVERLYADVVFPSGWEELAAPPFEMRARWTLEDLVGYLGTWSALVKYTKARGEDPLRVIVPKLQAAWGAGGERDVVWSVGMKAARAPGWLP
jgi:SAM-dependent methyltransferase